MTTFTNSGPVHNQAGSQTFHGPVYHGAVNITTSQDNAQLERFLPRANNAAFNSFERQHDDLCLKNTRVGILDEIRTWAARQDDRNIFWLSGLAGTGKSTIARTIAQEYQERLGASFFFSRGGGDASNARKFFTTIALQLAEKSLDLKRYICEATAKHGNIANEALRDQWRYLILQPLSKLESSFSPCLIIVVDALDECEDEHNVRTIVQLFAEVRSLSRVRLRILMTSRPEVPIRHGIDEVPDSEHQDFVLHKISSQIVDEDIALFFDAKFKELRKKTRLSPDWPGHQNIKVLVQKAAGLFIWAATAYRFVREGKKKRLTENRLSLLLNGSTSPTEPEKQLDQIYLTVLESSIGQDYRDEERAELCENLSTTLGTIVILFSPLSLLSLARLLPNLTQDLGQTPEDFHSISEDILEDLHSILDIPEDQSLPIRLHHPSFRDFLLDKERCNDPRFSVDEKKAHGSLAAACIQLMSESLRQDICGLRSPGALVNEVEQDTVTECIPMELQYACLYWVQHAQKSGIRLEDDGQVHAFLHNHLLHWLEALSLIQKTSEAVLALISLDSMDNKGLQLQAFIHDARRFATYNRSIIEEAPLQLYCSALIFAPKESIIRRRFSDQIPPWVDRHPEVPMNWSCLQQTLEGHSSWVNVVTFSPDGRLVASGSGDGKVNLWNITTGVLQQTLEGHSSSVSAVAFSSDGRLVASGSSDGTFKLWSTATGAVHQTIEDHLSSVGAATFSPDGRLVASGSDDGTVKLWDVVTGALQKTLEGHSSWVGVVTFSPDGSLMASGSGNGTVKLWDAATGALRKTLEDHSSSDQIYAVAFSPDGRLVASGSSDETVKLWDAATGTLQQTLMGHLSWVSAVAFSPDSRLVASGSDDETVKLWDTATGVLQKTFEGYSSPVRAVAFSPDSGLVALGSEDRTVKLWDATTSVLQQMLEGHWSEVSAVAFSQDGNLVASGSDDETVKLWDAATGVLQQTLEGHSSWVNAVMFSPDDKLIASSSEDHTIKLWDATTGALQHTLEGHSSWIRAVAFSPNGKLVASGSGDNTVKLWDTATGALQQTLEGHSSEVSAVAFSPDGKLVASSSGDGTVKLWDAVTGVLQQTLEGHSRWINAVAFSSDGKLVASSSEDHTIKLWDTTTGAVQNTLEGHTSSVNVVAFSPDGKLVASGSEDRTVKFWDTVTGGLQQTLNIDTVIFKLSFSADGPYLETDRGSLRIESPDYKIFPAPSASVYEVFVTERWVTRDGEKVLWLPHEYRAVKSAVRGNVVVLGHLSGRITFLEFKFS